MHGLKSWYDIVAQVEVKEDVVSTIFEGISMDKCMEHLKAREWAGALSFDSLIASCLYCLQV